MQEKLRAEREQLEKTAAAAEKSAEFVIGEEIIKAKESMEEYVAGMGTSKLQELTQSGRGSPVLFWSLVLVTLFALIVI